MDVLYQQSRRLLADTQRLLHDVTSGGLVVAGGGHEGRLQDNIEQLEQDCLRLENMARKEPPHKRQQVKMQVDQFVADFRSVQQGYTMYKRKREAAEQEARDREELLSQRFAPNSAVGDTTIQIDHGLHEHNRLSSAHQNMDALLDSGRSILGNLRDQKGILKDAQKKVLDVMNTLGLSNTVMRLIERRTAQDKCIFWGGVVITLVVMALVIYAFR